MKLNRFYILRGMTASGESTSLGNLEPFTTEAKALEAIAKGDVTLPNGCYAHVLEVYQPGGEEEKAAPAEKKAAAPKPKAAPAAKPAAPAPPAAAGADVA